MLEHIAKTLNIEPYRLFHVENDPNDPFERLYQRLTTDMKQIVNEAMEKAKDGKT